MWPEAGGAPEAPARVPWGARAGADDAWGGGGGAASEPPRPLTIRAVLTEEDVARIRAAGGGAAKLSVPMAVAGAAYMGLKWWLGDQLPDFVLYGLLVSVALISALLSYLRGQRYAGRPGAVAVTLSADGVELGAEDYASHVPWREVEALEVVEDLLVIRTKGTPPLHGCPLRGLAPDEVPMLQAWLHSWAQLRPPRRGVGLVLLAALGLLALAVWWAWDRYLAPLLSP
jgi:hypothetical protein